MKPEVQRKETFLKTIENSIGSRLFNNVYVKYPDSDKVVDVLDDSNYSCAYFVSCILYLFQAMDKPHATVTSTRKFIETSESWKKLDTESIKPGDVIFWEKVTFENGEENAHVGFALSSNEAVSTSSASKMVVKHEIKKPEIVFRYNW